MVKADHPPLLETDCTFFPLLPSTTKEPKGQSPEGFQARPVLYRNSGPRKSLVLEFLGITMTAPTLGFGLKQHLIKDLFLKNKKRQARPMAARSQSDLGSEVPSAHRCTAWGLLTDPRARAFCPRTFCPPSSLQDSGKSATPDRDT